MLGLIEAVPGVFCGQSCEAESMVTGSKGAPTQPLFRVIGWNWKEMDELADRHVLEEARTVRQEEV